MSTIRNHLPANCYSAKALASIDGVVIHYISAVNVDPANPYDLETIRKIFTDYKLSAHYLIDRAGTGYELVPLSRQAWHAGYSRMHGREACNGFTVGIEIMATPDDDFAPAQLKACAGIVAGLMREHSFSIDWVQGHDDVRAAWIAANPEKAREKRVPEKHDPGAHFDWPAFRKLVLEAVAPA